MPCLPCASMRNRDTGQLHLLGIRGMGAPLARDAGAPEDSPGGQAAPDSAVRRASPGVWMAYGPHQ